MIELRLPTFPKVGAGASRGPRQIASQRPSWAEAKTQV